ncbi:MAG TPA: hypothetical protein VMZ29_14095 [Candidatus Bathyarchaeia archaeon]|nr:hypothetical protein [Candidatus Bathyarchaeia archaeon]
MSLGPNLDETLQVIADQRREAVEEFKRADPQFRVKLQALFSLKIDLETIIGDLIQLVMDYGEYPHRAINVIPSLMRTTKDLQTTIDQHRDASNFQDLFPWNLNRLQTQYKDLKSLWIEKTWKLINIAKVKTTVDRSTLSNLQAAYLQQNTGGPI